MGVDAWLEAYRRAWEEGDADAAASLFTEDALYWSSPFREPHRGRDGVRTYWENATGTQQNVRVRLGRPITAGNRTAVEWWATMQDEDGEFTLPGILFLSFSSDGLCEELREAWMIEPGYVDPHAGWGE